MLVRQAYDLIAFLRGILSLRLKRPDPSCNFLLTLRD
jgi:hypothetical protein